MDMSDREIKPFIDLMEKTGKTTKELSDYLAEVGKLLANYGKKASKESR